MIDLTAVFSGVNLEPTWPQHPDQVVVSTRCVLTCPGCSAAASRGTIDQDVVAHLLCGANPDEGPILFAGADPLTNPSLEGMISHARAAGRQAEVLTPGVFVSMERARSLKRAGLNRLRIAVGGRPSAQDAARGIGSFDAAMRGAAAGVEAGLPVDLHLRPGSCRTDVREFIEIGRVLPVERLIVSSLGCRMPCQDLNQDEAEGVLSELLELAWLQLEGPAIVVEGPAFHARLLLEMVARSFGRRVEHAVERRLIHALHAGTPVQAWS